MHQQEQDMQGRLGGDPGSRQSAVQLPRFARVDDSSTAGLLHGCNVVTVDGQRVGVVDHLIVDLHTNQLRYVVLEKRWHCAELALPWHALYFDSDATELVFYTLTQDR